MLISTKGRYALRVMIELAMHSQEEFVPLRDIAMHQQISEKYLEAIMKKLVKEEFVIGLRGKKGGYRLARIPSSYTVDSILSVTEGSFAPVTCLEQGEVSCSRADSCITLPMWEDLNKLIHRYFEGITLKQLADRGMELEQKERTEETDRRNGQIKSKDA